MFSNWVYFSKSLQLFFPRLSAEQIQWIILLRSYLYIQIQKLYKGCNRSIFSQWNCSNRAWFQKWIWFIINKTFLVSVRLRFNCNLKARFNQKSKNESGSPLFIFSFCNIQHIDKLLVQEIYFQNGFKLKL